MTERPADKEGAEGRYRVPSDEVKEVKELLDAVERRLLRLVDWCTAVGVAGLGFLLTVLLQLRGEADVPSPLLAKAALVLLATSVLVGFAVRGCHELSRLGSDADSAVHAFGKLMRKTDLGLADFADLLKNVWRKAFGSKALKIVKLSILFTVKPVLAQMALLVLGLALSVAYVWLAVF